MIARGRTGMTLKYASEVDLKWRWFSDSSGDRRRIKFAALIQPAS